MGVILGSFWGHFGMKLASFWVVLALFCRRFGIILGSVWGVVDFLLAFFFCLFRPKGGVGVILWGFRSTILVGTLKPYFEEDT